MQFVIQIISIFVHDPTPITTMTRTMKTLEYFELIGMLETSPNS